VNKVVKGAARVSNAPENITTIVAATSGRVRYNNAVAVGRNVKSGESLFIMETGDVSNDNAAIKFAEAESRYNYLKAEYERKAQLVKTQIVTLGEFQSVEASYLQAKAVYETHLFDIDL
jgi:multidrug efflux pump subunit AcrA (membrane-fusion protein)